MMREKSTRKVQYMDAELPLLQMIPRPHCAVIPAMLAHTYILLHVPFSYLSPHLINPPYNTHLATQRPALHTSSAVQHLLPSILPQRVSGGTHASGSLPPRHPSGPQV